ncbi:MAG TPA: hypothetical protein VFW33_01070, partial [Gemmataceae bacterium]|nr:hypothetical protein [Gemmataceae bacterium]
DGLGQPADAYAVLGELSLAASGLPQLLGQVGRWLAAALAGGLVPVWRNGSRRGRRPGERRGRRPGERRGSSPPSGPPG